MMYLKQSKDQKYKNEWQKYNSALYDNFKVLQKITKLNYSELKIAYNYCNVTSSTSSIVSSAATRLQERWHEYNEGSMNPPEKGSPEYQKRLKLIESSIVNLSLADLSLQQEKCAVCLGEFSDFSTASASSISANVTLNAEIKSEICKNQISNQQNGLEASIITNAENDSIKQQLLAENLAKQIKQEIKKDSEENKIVKNTGHQPCRLEICHHYFHFECIRDWLLIKITCPVCRGSIHSSSTSSASGHHQRISPVSSSVNLQDASDSRAIVSDNSTDTASSSRLTAEINGNTDEGDLNNRLVNSERQEVQTIQDANPTDRNSNSTSDQGLTDSLNQMSVHINSTLNSTQHLSQSVMSLNWEMKVHQYLIDIFLGSLFLKAPVSKCPGLVSGILKP